ncbi:MAG TPA: 4Fe-4S binding protein [Caldisericia bacterium]|nr:4Fe-4S binding protein [Caldisericia bacterium]HPF48656.1 4Fe-4S binding protein [Caldisericia bacterium]HPI83684.1 4Fe-4S binding protein [Caldisericia bacterium]HPQ93111.1 4Fe-4S binding protein [Caldisericia bacterium]HRV75056.1 4Fe-4S binding protein [Caldisericia bacterium]
MTDKEITKTGQKLVRVVRQNRKRLTIAQIARYVTQTVFFVYVSMISLTHMYGYTNGFGFPGNAAGPLDCYCPFGGVETLPTFIAGGGTNGIVGGANFNDLLLLGALLLITVIFAGGFCGYLCPFGTLTDWIYKIRRLIFRREIKLHPRISFYLSFIKYFVLVALVTQATYHGFLVFSEFDPYRAFFHFGRDWTPLMIYVMLGVLVVSLLFERGFCNYVCPLGAVVNIGSLATLTKIKRNESSCTSCGLCDDACPMNLDVSGKLPYYRCIMCGECVEACPQGDESLSVTFAGEVWK